MLYDYTVFIGRFEPLHIGHCDVITSALKQSKRLILLVGSAHQPRTIKNPWTFEERREMIARFADDMNIADRIVVLPLRDYSSDQLWAAEVQNLVDGVVPFNASVALIGHSKDASSYYLNMFPQWSRVEHDMSIHVSATDLRKVLFQDLTVQFLRGVLPDSSYQFIAEFIKTPDFITLKEEYRCIADYKKSWEVAPYPPIFVTVDAVVVQSGHVILIRRKSAPGKGLWAMPGGFVEQDELLVDAMIRELREEVKLKVPEPVLKGSIVSREIIDTVDRSARGRTITVVYLIELPAGPLPRIKAGSDAMHAEWTLIADIPSDQMFEDHGIVIKQMLGRL